MPLDGGSVDGNRRPDAVAGALAGLPLHAILVELAFGLGQHPLGAGQLLQLPGASGVVVGDQSRLGARRLGVAGRAGNENVAVAGDEQHGHENGRDDEGLPQRRPGVVRAGDGRDQRGEGEDVAGGDGRAGDDVFEQHVGGDDGEEHAEADCGPRSNGGSGGHGSAPG